MKCQLARIAKGEDSNYEGLLLWIIMESPKFVESIEYHYGGRCPVNFRILLAYCGRYNGQPLTTEMFRLELLPFFTERTFTSWEEWEAKGGERMEEQ